MSSADGCKKRPLPSGKETSKPSCLLQRLREEEREMLLGYSLPQDLSEEQSRQRMDDILHHRSEFPKKLQSAIAEADRSSPSNHPKWFLRKFFRATTIFFLGRGIDSAFLRQCIYDDERKVVEKTLRVELTEEWHGLDSRIDTEAQAEVAIRVFPHILNLQNVVRKFGNFPALEILLARANAVSFLPLFLKLRSELIDKKGVGGGASGSIPTHPPYYAYWKQLLAPGKERWEEYHPRDRRYVDSVFGSDDIAASLMSKELDANSLAALVRIRGDETSGMGILHHNRETHNLLKWLLSTAFRTESKSHRGSEYIETRVRILVGWQPSMLKEFPRQSGYIPLLHVVSKYYHSVTVDDLRLFEGIFELGMLYFPGELGFLFHRSRIHAGHASMFHAASAALEYSGAERVAAMVRTHLLPHPAIVRNLQSCVLQAATNDDMCLDGLYTLVRSNPSSALMIN